MRLSNKFQTQVVIFAAGILVLATLFACTARPASAPVATPVVSMSTSTAEIPPNTPEAAQPVNTVAPEASAAEVVVYASDLPNSALFELDFYDDPASPGGKFISLPNNGDELDPPPEDDPHITFDVQVQSGMPYRCWIHMKVGTPLGRSTANVIWVQISDAVDEANNQILEPRSGSYLTAQGPTQEGWTWVGCNWEDSGAEPLVYFGTSGEVTVRLQAGSEGVGMDQFVLSPAKFLSDPPSTAIVEK